VYFTEHFWASPLNEVMNVWGGKLLKRALEIGLITLDDVHFGKDTDVLETLKASKDPKIKKVLAKLRDPYAHYKLGTSFAHSYKKDNKFRGIDPLIRVNDKTYKRLSEMNPSFASEYERVKAKMADGVMIQFTASA
jgi:hypothetical protein